MAAVTQTIPTFLGGVSKQIDSKKKPGQVRESINTLPDATFGLMKRPGTEYIESLSTSALPNAKWFYIHRDGDEQYIGRISTGSPGNIKIWNALSGVECDVYYDAAPWTADTAYIVGDKVTNDSGKIYQCDTAGTSASSGGPTGTGTDITDNTAQWDYVSGPTAQSYLQPAALEPDKPNINYDLLTVQDTTFITNKNKIITTRDAPAFTAGKKATVRLLTVRYGAKYNVKINGSTTSGGDADPTRLNDPTDEGTVLLNTKEILTALKGRIEALGTGIAVTQLDSTLELEHSSAFTIESIDDSGNANLEVFQEQVNTVADLPAQSYHDRLVKIINTADNQTTYWSKFVAEDGDRGRGYWEETVDPTVSPGLTGSTMPHELKNTDKNEFIFKEIAWKDRLVGDDETNEHPSFAKTGDRTIQQVFLHNNRLGFLTEDNVSISKSQDYYNFYFTSALTITAADPVDISASSIRPAMLHGVIPTPQGLVLFSKNQQFMLRAEDGIITPTSAIIRSISNYEMDTNIDPVDVGTSITFVSKTPSYTRLFGMVTRGSEENPVIEDISKIVSEWIPEDIDNLFSSPQNSITGVYSSSTKDIHMYRTYKTGGEDLLQSWFKWEMPGKVQFCTIDNDVVWLVVETDNADCILLKSSISKSVSAEAQVLETVDGKVVNPHMDFYKTPVAAGNVTLVDGDTLIDIPYADITSLTPVLLVKGTDALTITPTRNGDGSKYVIANRDLKTDTTYSDILLGYKYNYDIELPRFYFNKGDETVDYSANLTVARMKFAVGLSSVCSFKLKSRGYSGQSDEFTGDSSETAFKVPFLLKEENGRRITLDGAVQPSTAYSVARTVEDGVTIDNSDTVTFTTAPDGHTVKQLYGGAGYTIPTTGVATTSSGDGTGLVVNTTAGVGVPATITLTAGGTGYTASTNVATTGGGGTGLTVDITVDTGVVQTIAINTAGTGYTVDSTVTVSTGGADCTFKIASAVGAVSGVVVASQGSGYKPNEVITIAGGTTSSTLLIDKLPQSIKITTDTWYDVQPVQDAGQYLADDVPLIEENVFTIPLHQRSGNFDLRVFSNSPFPVSLNSMMWEGQYSPRYYRRT